MSYEEELKQFMTKAECDRNVLFKQFDCVNTCSAKNVELERKLRLLNSKHNEEFRRLREKYHLPPPEVVDSIERLR